MSLKSHLETLESQLCGGINPAPVVMVIEWYCERFRCGEFAEQDQALVVAMRIKDIISVSTYKGGMRSGEEVKQVVEIIKMAIMFVPDKVQSQLAITIEFLLNYLPRVEKVTYDQ